MTSSCFETDRKAYLILVKTQVPAIDRLQAQIGRTMTIAGRGWVG